MCVYVRACGPKVEPYPKRLAIRLVPTNETQKDTLCCGTYQMKTVWSSVQTVRSVVDWQLVSLSIQCERALVDTVCKAPNKNAKIGSVVFVFCNKEFSWFSKPRRQLAVLS